MYSYDLPDMGGTMQCSERGTGLIPINAFSKYTLKYQKCPVTYLMIANVYQHLRYTSMHSFIWNQGGGEPHPPFNSSPLP